MSSKTMKALIYAGVGNYLIQDRPIPKIQLPTDAVVKMVHTTICGTDLHTLKGDVATCATGRVLGHEGIAIVQEVGSGVKHFKPGDKVIVSCITACGSCYYCRKNMSGHCADGGWTLGHTIDGTQAEYTRIPYADGSLHHCVKAASEEDQILVSDVLPTGFECGVINGSVEPGSVVAVVGSGPVGLGAVITAQLYSPSTLIVIDLDGNRLKAATRLGATHTLISGPNTVSEVMKLTNGRGVDTVIEAVGLPKSLELCQDLVAVGGTIANLGVHGCKVDLYMEKLWSHNITLRTRQVDAVSSPMLIRLLDAGKLKTDGLITHRFTFREMEDAYKTFGKAAEHNALKMLISF
ncbi:alcohol dehydrogenase domain protein [Moniliophthora roreri MCA 2997]|uniref:Alcohol dehydrogenase domain protein n=2 Tax=Moniliophthora roreri TaxID=221103 RepID=V2Y7Z1_MONRO|nr:alcohol dehydrogenase domain protein [Moniliophthora roreri MCA 2997]KAI3618055.1 alcohol dehydrogenase domain protein [Moniliophthora roreri]